jgi:hypothetical protein
VQIDIALTEDDDGRILVHRVDCPYARTHAMLGRMVANLFGCEELPADVERHDCLKEF